LSNLWACVCVQSDVRNLNFLIGVMLYNVISYYNLHTYKQNEVLTCGCSCFSCCQSPTILPHYSNGLTQHTIVMNNLYTIFESKSTLAF